MHKNVFKNLFPVKGSPPWVLALLSESMIIFRKKTPRSSVERQIQIHSQMAELVSYTRTRTLTITSTTDTPAQAARPGVHEQQHTVYRTCNAPAESPKSSLLYFEWVLRAPRARSSTTMLPPKCTTARSILVSKQ